MLPKSKPETTALDLVQEGIKGLKAVEKLIQDAKVSADPKARRRGMPGPTALLRITDAILALDWNVLSQLSEWAKQESFWVEFQRRKKANKRRK